MSSGVLHYPTHSGSSRSVNSLASVYPNQRWRICLDESSRANSGEPIGKSNSCQGVWSWKFTLSTFMQLAYCFLIPFTMGSISLHSTQVTAKNSIKVKSACFGTAAETVVAAGDKTAVGVTAISTCAVLGGVTAGVD